jgi:uncharacterized damage-inducible protein DinB
MPVTPEYSAENKHSCERLKRLIDQLNENDLIQPMENGWSVATLLVHLAFWDQLVLNYVTRWQRDGFENAPLSKSAINAINETVRAISTAIAPLAAAQLAMSSAEVLDLKLEQLSEALATEIQKAGRERILRRAVHRTEHLERIENVLGKQG